MFTGFTDDTIRFFLDLKFHNSTEYFHQEHERYLKDVQKPFYDFIEDLGSQMKDIDPLMEIRPYKCLSHIHRDTRFSRDKSPYRDHLWLLFRRAAGVPMERSESVELRHAKACDGAAANRRGEKGAKS